MGSCVSLSSRSNPAMNLGLSVNATEDLAVNGSKEEAFFDSQPWLESDSEDDFCSVNGDFTPSRGSTPVHHTFSLQVNKAPIVEETMTIASVVAQVHSPTDKTNTLSQLFNESSHGDDATEKTPEHGVLRNEEKSTQCCLPKLISSRSFSERRKRRMSPANNIVG